MDFFKIIKTNKYLNQKHNYKSDKNSLCFLLFEYLNENNITINNLNNFHSICIKIGISLEKIITEYIVSNTNLKNINHGNVQNKIQEDNLFLDENNKIIYYAELKSNLNLDTEKIKATNNKIIMKEKELKEMYKDYKIMCFLVNLRYLKYDEIPNKLINKFNIEYLKGLNDYLNLLNLNKIKNYDVYKEILYRIFKKLNN